MKYSKETSFVCLLVLFFAGISHLAVAEILADSGYPMDGANPQRNYQSNRKLLCPNVAPGRSQVLQSKWTFPKEKNLGPVIIGVDVTLDESGNVYAGWREDENYYFIKLNGTDGKVIKKLAIPYDPVLAYPTHVKGGKFYYAGDRTAYLVDSTTMTVVGDPIVHNEITDFNVHFSYAPYKDTHMVSSNMGIGPNPTVDTFTYIKTSDMTQDLTQFNFVLGSPSPVLVYKDDTYEFPIVASLTGSFPFLSTSIISPRYSFNVTETMVRVWIEGSTLHMYTRNGTGDPTIFDFYELNAVTGALLSKRTIDTFAGSEFFGYNVYVVNNISVAEIRDGNNKALIVDILNDRYLFPQTLELDLHSAAMFSKPDNTMLMQVSPLYQRIELIGLDWDTFEVNTRGLFPSDNMFSDIIIGTPVIGEDCHVYTTLNNRVFAFAPLPIQDIVPIFECVNEDGVAYFSYKNLMDHAFAIPQLFDRNNLSPLNVTPGVDFEADRRGKYFPLSFRVNFGTTGTFVWQLEDYVLSVTLNSSLLCPQTVRFKIFLTADEPFPNTFAQSVRLLFASVAGINETRVTVVSTGKRFVEQSATELEIELQVVPHSSSSEPTPEQAVQDFVEEQLGNFNSQLGGLPDAPANVTTRDVDGVPLETEILGEKPPVVPPTTAESPVTVNTPTKVSSSSNVKMSMVLSVFVLILTLAICF